MSSLNALTHVFDRQKVAQPLGGLLGTGGEGSVYRLQQRPDLVVKCYHGDKLAKQGDALKAKVEAMITLRDNIQKSGPQAPFSWPLLSVYDEQGQWMGYAMKAAAGEPMSRLAHPMLCAKKFVGLDRTGVVTYLMQFLKAVQTLHRMGVMVGDYNLNNVMCTPGSNQISLIDCDSYQANVQGRWFACPVGSPDMTPPEHHGVSFDMVQRTLTSEMFSVAIVLFKCLMLGRHPYDIVGGDDPVRNLKSGRFAYGIGNTGVPKGPWYNIWSHMPFRLKSMFIQTFTEGARTPDKRHSLAEWHEALSVYRSELQKGWHEVALIPKVAKSKARHSMSGPVA